MLDYRKESVESLKEKINEITGGFIEDEQLKDLKRPDLIKIHKSLTSEQKEEPSTIPMFDNTEPDPPQSTNEHIPNPLDPEWHTYVMTQFAPEEMVPDAKGNKNPSIAGLRRVAQRLIGEIISSKPVKVQSILEGNTPGKAIVEYEIVFDTGGREKVFASVASSWFGNTDDEYAVFPEAMAETRAEGRTLRKALGIRTVCADEITSKNTTEIIEQFKNKIFSSGEGGLITDTQIKMITTLCDRLQISKTKFINDGSKQYDDITDIPYATAINMIKRLNKYQGSADTNLNHLKEIENESSVQDKE